MKTTTRNLIEAFKQDVMPSYATQVDFGIQPTRDPTQPYGALQWAYLKELVTPSELDLASGDGQALTDIVRREHPEIGGNPYWCEICTEWDYLSTTEGE